MCIRDSFSTDAENGEVAEVDEGTVVVGGTLLGEGVTAVPGGALNGSRARNRVGELVAGSHRESVARLSVCVRRAYCAPPKAKEFRINPG